MPTLKRQRSRLSRERGAAVRGMSSRSSRRRAARERWSRSTLGALLLDRLVLIMAPSTARLPPAEAGGRPTNSSPIPRRCVSRFTLPAIYFAEADAQVGLALVPDSTTCRVQRIGAVGLGGMTSPVTGQSNRRRITPSRCCTLGAVSSRAGLRRAWEGRIAGLDGKISFNFD